MIELAEVLADHTVVSIYFLRVSLVLGGVYLLASLWKNASASLKSGILRTGFLGLYVLPLLYFFTPNWDVGAPIPAPEVNPLVEQTADTFVPPPNALRISPASSVTSSKDSSPKVITQDWIGEIGHIPFTKVFMLIWGLGICALVARWVNDERLVRKMLKNGVMNRSSEVHRVLDEVITTLKVKRNIILLESASIGSPITVGVFRPVILLPVTARHWSVKQLRAVFLHEVAHIRRHDCLLYACVQVMCVTYWMNPFVWLAKKRLIVEQEKACDDEVLLSGMVRLEYAEHLVSIARWANWRINRSQPCAWYGAGAYA